jgi:ubiquinone biosynthesis protein COQ9
MASTISEVIELIQATTKAALASGKEDSPATKKATECVISLIEARCGGDKQVLDAMASVRKSAGLPAAKSQRKQTPPKADGNKESLV